MTKSPKTARQQASPSLTQTGPGATWPWPVGVRLVGVPPLAKWNTAFADDADAMVRRTILLVSGSLRRTSTNTALLRTAAEVADGVECRIYPHLARLPAFNPDEDLHPLHPEVQRLRDAIHQADAIMFSTPEYAGALPGSLKNLLDWTIGDEQAGSIYEKPVGWVNASPRGADQAHRELRTVLGYAHARLIDAACAQIPVTPQMIGSDGLVHDHTSRAALESVVTALATHPVAADWL
jgi:chromate reductase